MIIDAQAKSYDKTTKIVPTKTVPTKRASTNFYIFIDFLLIVIALWITVANYCCLIKHRTNEKHLLPYYVTNNKIKESLYL